MYEAKRNGGAGSAYATADIKPATIDLRDQPSPTVVGATGDPAPTIG